jgi:hypothetical protein
MKNGTRQKMAIALLAGLPLAAAAQPAIWRCGNSYSEQPCAGGTEIEAKSAPARPEEAARSAAATRRDARLADEMEKDRLARERQSGKAIVIANGPRAAEAARAAASGGKGKKGKGKSTQAQGEPVVTVKLPAAPKPSPLK